MDRGQARSAGHCWSWCFPREDETSGPAPRHSHTTGIKTPGLPSLATSEGSTWPLKGFMVLISPVLQTHPWRLGAGERWQAGLLTLNPVHVTDGQTETLGIT